MDVKDEELIRKAEILLDSSTQKALRGLAYLRVLRQRLTNQIKSHQMTLTSVPGKGKSKKKKWKLPPPKGKDTHHPEYKMWAKCWFCDEIFQKIIECQKCKLFKCPNCGKCGCHLSNEARKAVYYVLDCIFGKVSPKY